MNLASSSKLPLKRLKQFEEVGGKRSEILRYLFRGRENGLLIKRLRLSAAPGFLPSLDCVSHPRSPPAFWGVLRGPVEAAAALPASIRSPRAREGARAPIASKRKALPLPPGREFVGAGRARQQSHQSDGEIREAGEKSGRGPRSGRPAGFASPRPSGLPRQVEPAGPVSLAGLEGSPGGSAVQARLGPLRAAGFLRRWSPVEPGRGATVAGLAG